MKQNRIEYITLDQNRREQNEIEQYRMEQKYRVKYKTISQFHKILNLKIKTFHFSFFSTF